MQNFITKNETVHKMAVFDKQRDNRYELTISIEAKKKKSILIIGLNPASDNIQVLDTTTNYIINNLFPMGYTTITLCNLFSVICTKLKVSNIIENESNRTYIQELLQREFQAVIVGYGNTYTNNRKVNAEKKFMDSILRDYKGNVFEIVDKKEQYSRLKTIHPLFAGQRFSGEWKFRKYVVKESEKNPNDEKNMDSKTVETTETVCNSASSV